MPGGPTSHKRRQASLAIGLHLDRAIAQVRGAMDQARWNHPQTAAALQVIERDLIRVHNQHDFGRGPYQQAA